MKAIVPALSCVIGLFYCSWKVSQTKYAAPHYKVEITVHGPDGKIIPAIAHR